MQSNNNISAFVCENEGNPVNVSEYCCDLVPNKKQTPKEFSRKSNSIQNKWKYFTEFDFLIFYSNNVFIKQNRKIFAFGMHILFWGYSNVNSAKIVHDSSWKVALERYSWSFEGIRKLRGLFGYTNTRNIHSVFCITDIKQMSHKTILCSFLF